MELSLYHLFTPNEKLTSLYWSLVSLLSVGLLGFLDYLTGPRINISLFYLVPIVLATWVVHHYAGFFISFVSALTWLAAEFAGVPSSSLTIYFWNSLIHAGFFVTVTYLLAQLHTSHRKEQRAARSDFLTGAMNRRYFYELVQLEIDRIPAYSHPFTVVYLDLDNFKQMNDRYGHEMGDEVLRTVVSQLKSMLRKTDIIARLGGDEFSILLPFTDQEGAEAAVGRVHSHLKSLVNQKSWPVTVSMGSVTCLAAPVSLEHLMDLADQVMYEVKKSTKNDAHFITWGEHSEHLETSDSYRNTYCSISFARFFKLTGLVM